MAKTITTALQQGAYRHRRLEARCLQYEHCLGTSQLSEGRHWHTRDSSLSMIFLPGLHGDALNSLASVQMCAILGKQTIFTIVLVLPQRPNVCGCI
jgi:hypothetical protein